MGCLILLLASHLGYSENRYERPLHELSVDVTVKLGKLIRDYSDTLSYKEACKEDRKVMTYLTTSNTHVNMERDAEQTRIWMFLVENTIDSLSECLLTHRKYKCFESHPSYPDKLKTACEDIMDKYYEEYERYEP